MYKLTVLNMTASSISHTDHWFRYALILEAFLLLISLFEICLTWYLLRFTSQYHRNLAMIVEQAANQYILSIFSRFYIIYMQLNITDTAVLIEQKSFLIAVWLRNTLLFISFYFAPFPVFERAFATHYITDYEKKQRRWISYFLSFVLLFVAFTSAQFFVFQKSGREIHLILISIFNFSAFGLTYSVEICNKKKYDQIRKNNHLSYSLSERAQLSEILNTTKPFKAMCFSFAFSASLCSTMLHIDEYIEDEQTRNWVYIIFNYCCWSYGTFVPLIMYFYNSLWHRECRRLWKKISCSSNQINPERTKTKVRIRDTFGRNCFVESSQHTDVYFSQLQTAWDSTEQNNEQEMTLKPNRKRPTSPVASVSINVSIASD